MNPDEGRREVRIFVLTVSDRASAGVYEDLSGPAVIEAAVASLGDAGFAVSCDYGLVPDEREAVADRVAKAADAGCALVLTTGGTGIGPRDVTPEATRDVIDREVPGLMEEVRRRGAAQAPGALLSRAVAGMRGRCLVVNLPGSVKAVGECLEVVLPVVPHALDMAQGGDHPAG